MMGFDFVLLESIFVEIPFLLFVVVDFSRSLHHSLLLLTDKNLR